jgi:hypothetical protein
MEIIPGRGRTLPNGEFDVKTSVDCMGTYFCR